MSWAEHLKAVTSGLELHNKLLSGLSSMAAVAFD